MNRKLSWILAILSLMSLLLLASCKDGSQTDETGTGTDSGTTAETEAVTAIPRYDYMDAVVAPDVEIDRADYVDITLTVPNSLKVEDEDVQAYLASGILFKHRTAVNGTAMVKDQALKPGDDAYIYYKGFVDGKAALRSPLRLAAAVHQPRHRCGDGCPGTGRRQPRF